MNDIGNFTLNKLLFYTGNLLLFCTILMGMFILPIKFEKPELISTILIDTDETLETTDNLYIRISALQYNETSSIPIQSSENLKLINITTALSFHHDPTGITPIILNLTLKLELTEKYTFNNDSNYINKQNNEYLLNSNQSSIKETIFWNSTNYLDIYNPSTIKANITFDLKISYIYFIEFSDENTTIERKDIEVFNNLINTVFPWKSYNIISQIVILGVGFLLSSSLIIISVVLYFRKKNF